MAKFTDLRLTETGILALAESQVTNTALIIGAESPGYIEIGDGVKPIGMEHDEMTELISPRIRAAIISRQFKSDGTVQIAAQVDNADLTEDIIVREIGIPARLENSNDTILYAYDNAGDSAGLIPAGGGSGYLTHIFRINIVISNAANIIINIDSISKLENTVDEYISSDGQQDFTPVSTDINGAFILFVDGIAKFDWTVVNDMVRLAEPLSGGQRVNIVETRTS